MMTTGVFGVSIGRAAILAAIEGNEEAAWRKSADRNAVNPGEPGVSDDGNSSTSIMRRLEGCNAALLLEVDEASPSNSRQLYFSPRPRKSSNCVPAEAYP